MKFIEPGTDTSDIEKGVRNAWKWFWLDEYSSNGNGEKYGTWCKKIDDAGKCFCIICNKIMNYASSGKKALRSHDQFEDHIKRWKIVQSTSKIMPATAGVSAKSFHDKCCEIKSVLSLFTSEHCLPFTLVPELLTLAKRISQDSVALNLNAVSLSRTSATYTTTHGVGQYIKDSLSSKLKDSFFSLNIDEATTNAGNKLLNILVQFFDTEEEKFVVDLLGSREVNLANATNLLNAVTEVLEERGLHWHQVISVLMDNCAVMRGVKEGVEAKIRNTKNKNLLDVSGDSVHMVNNAAKKLFQPLEKDFFNVQTLASEIYYDVEDSPKVRCLFFQIQELLYKKKRSLFRPIPTRFLQMKTVCDRLIDLWDALQLYYSAFLSDKEKKLRHQIQQDIFAKYELTADEVKTVQSILLGQQQQKKSDASSGRKDSILNSLFDNAFKAKFAIQLHRGILKKFQGYVLIFQSAKPMCHSLHYELFKLVKSFYSCFITSEHISEFNAKTLDQLAFTDESLQQKDRNLCVGEFCTLDIMKCVRDKKKYPWLSSFFKALRQGYVAAAHSMKKLPLNNPTLVKMSFLDPSNQRSSASIRALLCLGESLPNVIPPTDLGKLDEEIRRYITDDEVSLFDADSDDTDFRIDTMWWSLIFKLKHRGDFRYPTLGKLVKALLSVFSGPLVEGTFNIMDDIIEEDRSRMTTFNYEAIAMTKTYLSTRNLKSTSMTIAPSMIKCVAKSWDTFNKYTEKSRPALPVVPTNPQPAHSATTTSMKTATPTAPSTTSTLATTTTLATTNPQPATSINTTSKSLPTNTGTPIQPILPSSTSTSTHSVNSSQSPSQPLSVTSGVKRKQASLVGFFSKRPKPS